MIIDGDAVLRRFRVSVGRRSGVVLRRRDVQGRLPGLPRRQAHALLPPGDALPPGAYAGLPRLSTGRRGRAPL